MKTFVALTLTALTATLAAQDKVDALIKTAEEVEKEVEALRGIKFKTPVKKGVHTVEQLRGFITKKLFEENLKGDKLVNTQVMLATLGFIPPNMDLRKTIVDVLLSQIGGFYDPDREAFFMMQRAADYGEFVNRMMIAHELTHALDDQYHPLDPIMKKHTGLHDDEFAVGSVIEGSATALMYRWSAKYGKNFDMSELKKAMRSEAEKAKVLINAPPYFSTLVARYMAGMAFVTKGKGMIGLMQMKDGVGDNVAKALDNVPASSEQILHPAKYWNPDKLDAPVELANPKEFEAELTKLAGGRIVHRDTLGEIHMALLTRSPKRKLNMGLMAQASYWTNRAARGWGGDHLWLIEHGAGDGKTTGIVWLTWWDEAEDAVEFETAYRKHYAASTGLKSARKGRTVAFAFGDCAGLIDDLLALQASSAKLTKGGQPFDALR